jgi:hypothetical protein
LSCGGGRNGQKDCECAKGGNSGVFRPELQRGVRPLGFSHEQVLVQVASIPGMQKKLPGRPNIVRISNIPTEASILPSAERRDFRSASGKVSGSPCSTLTSVKSCRITGR